MLSKYAILLDGGFVTKKLQGKLKHFPTAADVNQECQRIVQNQHLANRDLLRIYFYDASPAKDRLTNPIDGSPLDLSATSEFREHISLLDTLELTPNFAVRRIWNKRAWICASASTSRDWRCAGWLTSSWS